MKKIFIVMLLVIASGLWNSTNGACMVPAKSNSDLPTITMSGILYETAYPCEPGEMCPTCLTPALETDNGIYYLTTTDAEIEAQLDSLFNYLYSINCICTFPTRVTGTTYQNGSFKYINISHMETGDPYSYDAMDSKKIIGSWQVYKETRIANEYNEFGELEYITKTQDVNDSRTYNFNDSTLLIVCPTCYHTPQRYILTPINSMKWNLWVENIFTLQEMPSDPSISGTSINTIHQLTKNHMEWEYILYGGDEGPTTYYQYLRRVGTEDADTIPLYTGDDPGSSTVDPIDPNQVVVTLNGNELNIKESSGDEINYTLVLNKNKQAPTKEQTVQANSFIHSVSIELFESGYYTLRLTNPKWTNSLVGHFQYINTAIEEVQGDERCNTKILRDGQLLIRVGERLYTPTGIQIQ